MLEINLNKRRINIVNRPDRVEMTLFIPSVADDKLPDSGEKPTITSSDIEKNDGKIGEQCVMKPFQKQKYIFP